MTLYTQGPWYATKEHVQSSYLNEDNYICTAEGISQEQTEANATLLAASWDLRELLKEVVENFKASEGRSIPFILVDSIEAELERLEQ
jgi:hypothetical protein